MTLAVSVACVVGLESGFLCNWDRRRFYSDKSLARRRNGRNDQSCYVYNYQKQKALNSHVIRTGWDISDFLIDQIRLK
jgi:hypothetical protein